MGKMPHPRINQPINMPATKPIRALYLSQMGWILTRICAKNVKPLASSELIIAIVLLVEMR
jgi:hypothetical protein